MCGKHKVTHCKRAVVNSCAALLICQHNKYCGRAVKRVKALLPTAYFAVHFGYFVAHFSVRNGNDYRRLLIHTRRRIKSRLDNLIHKLLRYCVGLKLSYTSSRFHIFDSFHNFILSYNSGLFNLSSFSGTKSRILIINIAHLSSTDRTKINTPYFCFVSNATLST